MTDLGNRYALSAMKLKRATLAGEIAELKKKLAWAEECLIHVDASLQLLDPTAQPSTIPARRPKRVKLFKQGELSGKLLAILRKAGEPMLTKDVLSALLERDGLDESARPGLQHRVSSNLDYLRKTGRVTKGDARRQAKWQALKQSTASPRLRIVGPA